MCLFCGSVELQSNETRRDRRGQTAVLRRRGRSVSSMVMVCCPQASSQALNRKQISHLYCLELFSTEQWTSVTFSLTFLVQNSLGFLIVVTLYAIEMLGLDIKLSIDNNYAMSPDSGAICWVVQLICSSVAVSSELVRGTSHHRPQQL